MDFEPTERDKKMVSVLFEKISQLVHDEDVKQFSALNAFMLLILNTAIDAGIQKPHLLSALSEGFETMEHAREKMKENQETNKND